LIDIHNHILPGIDDGPKTEQDSIAMAKYAVDQGIHTVVATPHHKNGRFNNKKEEILKYVSVLNELFKSKNIPLTVLVGQEVRIYGDILEDIDKNEILTVNHSKYLLIELPFDEVPYYTEKLLYDIQLAGYIPVIVHPERNAELRRDYRKMYDLVLKGSLTQLTAGSILGHFGKEIEQFSHNLIQANLTHLIASDAHDVISRPFELQEAYALVKQQYGLDTYYMFLENSNLLIDNMNLNRYEPMPIRKKRKWLFGRS